MNNSCLPLMSDGRAFTEYRPNCYVERLIMDQNYIYNSFDLKNLLTNNALTLQRLEREFYMKKSCLNNSKLIMVDPNHNDKLWEKYKNSINNNTKVNL